MTLLLPTLIYNHGPFVPNCRRHRPNPWSMDNVFMDHPHEDPSGLFGILEAHPWFVTAGRRHPGLNRKDQMQWPMFVSDLSDPCCDAEKKTNGCQQGEKTWCRRIKMEGFGRDEVTVKIGGRHVLVEGQKKILIGKEKEAYDTVRMTRDLHVPDDVDTTTLGVFHCRNGELVLVAKHKRKFDGASNVKKEDNVNQITESHSSNKHVNDDDTADFECSKCECDDDTMKDNCSCTDNERSPVECACRSTNKNEEDKGVGLSVTLTKEAEDKVTSIPVSTASEEIQSTENKDDAKMMNLKVDLSGFKPEEIEVKVKDERVIVHARHEDTTDECNSYREVFRVFTLPVEADITSLQSGLREDGTLFLQAPLSDIDSNDAEI